tara:strand:+ start:1807 stop:2457 length:651 start_codon:yes stop_codon:yes gene_type:complete
MKTFFAWHFTSDKMRDGSPLPEVGVWEHYEGKLELCAAGLHWSRDPFDALQHAPGATLRRVEIKGDFLEQEDKGCSHYRRAVYQTDATDLLRYFARMQALSVIHLYPNGTDDVVFDYLMAGDESLRDAARASALAAAGASAWDAAQAAAGASAWAASRAAAWSAAWAAGASARAAAVEAARAAAVEAAVARVAGAAARAAGDVARKDFSKLIGAAI